MGGRLRQPTQGRFVLYRGGRHLANPRLLGRDHEYVAVQRDVTLSERLRNARSISPGSAPSSRRLSAACAQATRPRPPRRRSAVGSGVSTGVKAAASLPLRARWTRCADRLRRHGPVRPAAETAPAQRSRHLHERATEGPWIEPWVNRPSYPYNQLLSSLGSTRLRSRPCDTSSGSSGCSGSTSRNSVEEFAAAEALPALVEFADLAGALIGRDVAERTEVGRGRNRIADIIAHQAFGPVSNRSSTSGAMRSSATRH